MANKRALITGGAGFIGRRLGQRLAGLGWEVTLFDVHSAHKEEKTPGVHAVVGDLSDYPAVQSVCQGCDLVFHVASYGMSGHEAINRQRVYEVNVQGTQNVLRACQAEGVGRLVYVSTYNAVFDGSRPIYGADEKSVQLIDYAHCWCPYTATKAQAEEMVLAADKSPLLKEPAAVADSSCEISEFCQLRTCVIRPAGIYGPGERRHTMRILRMARMGLLQFVFGDPKSLVDFIHCENMCDGLIQAAEGLSAERRAVAGGQAYFMNDGKPVNNFMHWQGIVEGAGYRWPTLRLPFLLIFWAGAVMELTCQAAWFFGIPLTPLLSRTEALKCAVTHYFVIDKARKELGYDPKPYDLHEVGRWYRENGWGSTTQDRKQQRTLLSVLLLAVALVVVALAALLLAS